MFVMIDKLPVFDDTAAMELNDLLKFADFKNLGELDSAT